MKMGMIVMAIALLALVVCMVYQTYEQNELTKLVLLMQKNQHNVRDVLGETPNYFMAETADIKPWQWELMELEGTIVLDEGLK